MRAMPGLTKMSNLNRTFSLRLNRTRLHKEYLFVWGDRVRWFLHDRSKRKERADAAIAKAKTCGDQNDGDAVVKEISEVIDSDPSNDLALFHRGLVYCRLGRYDEALWDFMKAVRLCPTCKEAYYNIGWVYSKTDRQDQALVYFDRYIRVRPDDADAYISRGFSRMDMKMYREARQDFIQAQNMRPDVWEPFYAAACLESIANNPDETNRWLKEAIKRGFADVERLNADSDFDNIRGSSGYKEILGLLVASEGSKSQPEA